MNLSRDQIQDRRDLLRRQEEARIYAEAIAMGYRFETNTKKSGQESLVRAYQELGLEVIVHPTAFHFEDDGTKVEDHGSVAILGRGVMKK